MRPAARTIFSAVPCEPTFNGQPGLYLAALDDATLTNLAFPSATKVTFPGVLALAVAGTDVLAAGKLGQIDGVTVKNILRIV